MDHLQIQTPTPASWVATTLEFIERNYAGSALSQEILTRLKSLHRDGRIVFADLGQQKLGRYNHLTRRLTLNVSQLAFLRHDFGRQLKTLKDPERVHHVRDQHARAVIELSGVLIHEGAHAVKFRWSRKADEAAAFEAERLWYGHLGSLYPRYRDYTAQLVGDSATDGALFADSNGEASFQ